MVSDVPFVQSGANSLCRPPAGELSDSLLEEGACYMPTPKFDPENGSYHITV